MLTITIQLDTDNIIGVKEALCMFLERWGNAKVVSIEKQEPEQMRI